MARKRLLTKTEIVDAATSIVESDGLSAVNARSIAKACHTSTQPLFTIVSSVSEIIEAVKTNAYSIYDSLIREALSGTVKPFQAVGLAYLRFAEEHPHLFRLIFMAESDQSFSHFNIDHNEPLITQDVMGEYGLDQEYARRMYFESWVFTHGLAVSIVTKTLSLSKEEILLALHDVVYGIYLRLKEEMGEKI